MNVEAAVYNFFINLEDNKEEHAISKRDIAKKVNKRGVTVSSVSDALENLKNQGKLNFKDGERGKVLVKLTQDNFKWDIEKIEDYIEKLYCKKKYLLDISELVFKSGLNKQSLIDILNKSKYSTAITYDRKNETILLKKESENISLRIKDLDIKEKDAKTSIDVDTIPNDIEAEGEFEHLLDIILENVDALLISSGELQSENKAAGTKVAYLINTIQDLKTERDILKREKDYFKDLTGQLRYEVSRLQERINDLK